MSIGLLDGKKILLVHSSAELYGSDRCLLAIVREIVNRGAEAHVALPAQGPLTGELRLAGATVHLLDTVVFRRDVLNLAGMLRMMIRTPVAIARLHRLMRRHEFDLVHTNTGVTVGGAVAARLARIPHIWHFREILSEFGFFLRLYQPVVAFLSDRLIFITAAVRDQFSSARLKGMGTVIHDGIAVGPLEGTAPETDEGPTVVTTVGRLAPYKGQDVLIQALARAEAQGIDLEAYIVGDVYGDRYEYREELERLASRLGLREKIHFTGFQDDVRPYLEKCNVFVLSSVRQEGLGIVMLEAMAAGRAVIATDGGGAPEVITDGVDGILIPTGESGRMAEAIVRLARDPEERRRFAASGREKVRQRFSEVSMVGAVIDLYEELMEEKARQ